MCKLCGGAGVLPFKNHEGKIVPHVFVDCDCKLEPEFDLEKVTPDMIDYPENIFEPSLQ